MRISDWSSDVCSNSFTIRPIRTRSASCGRQSQRCKGVRRMNEMTELASIGSVAKIGGSQRDRKSVGEGKSVSVRVDLGGRRISKKKRRDMNTIPKESC